MLSVILDRFFYVFCGLALLSRLLLQPSLNHLETLGQEHISTLLNSLIIFIITFLFLLKKTVLRLLLSRLTYHVLRNRLTTHVMLLP